METIVRGRTWEVTGVVYDSYNTDTSTGVPSNLTGVTVKAEMRTRLGNELVADLNAVLVVPTSGTFKASLTREQTAALPLGDYVWDFIAVIDGLDVAIVPVEPIKVSDHPTQP